LLRDEELVDLIAASGGKWVFIGMESIDPANLADVNKGRSEEHTSELQSRFELVCRLLLEKKNRFSCTFNSGATAVTSGAYIAIVQTATGTARTFYLDGVQLEGGSTVTPYGAGSFSLNGVI